MGDPHTKVLCPFHDDHDPSLSVNLRTGRAFCFVCRRGTRVDPGSLHGEASRTAGRGAQRPLSLSEVLQRLTPCSENTMVELWLARRRLRPWVAHDLGMRALRVVGKEFIVFCYFRADGRLGYCKLRRVDLDTKQIYRVPAGVSSVLYNLPGLDALRDDEPPIIVEGEPDVVAIVQAGEPGVVSVPDGNGTKVDDALLRLLKRFSRVKIGVDDDNAGHQLAARLLTALKPRSCERISWKEGNQ